MFACATKISLIIMFSFPFNIILFVANPLSGKYCLSEIFSNSRKKVVFRTQKTSVMELSLKNSERLFSQKLSDRCLRWFQIASDTAQKMKFSIKDFFSKCDQIRSFLRTCSHLLKKSLTENIIFCAV